MLYYEYDPATHQRDSMSTPVFAEMRDFFSYDKKCYFTNYTTPEQGDLYRWNNKTQAIEKLTNVANAFINVYSVHDVVLLNNSVFFAADSDPAPTGNNFELYRYIDQDVSVDVTNPVQVAHIYPNPATGAATISLPVQLTNMDILLTDMKGSIVYNTRIAKAQNIVVPVQHLQTGTYTYSVSQGRKEIFSGKLVKQ
jgi:hypothetical protein